MLKPTKKRWHPIHHGRLHKVRELTSVERWNWSDPKLETIGEVVHGWITVYYRKMEADKKWWYQMHLDEGGDGACCCLMISLIRRSLLDVIMSSLQYAVDSLQLAPDGAHSAWWMEWREGWKSERGLLSKRLFSKAKHFAVFLLRYINIICLFASLPPCLLLLPLSVRGTHGLSKCTLLCVSSYTWGYLSLSLCLILSVSCALISLAVSL